MNESTPEQTPEEAQQMLNAQIQYSIDGLASAAHTLELDGIHPSAVTSASLAIFVQLMCAASLLAGRSLEEVQKAITESMSFTQQYAKEVYETMQRSLPEGAQDNAI